jgi:glycosyltransferase involved in cell wall biosynthesis
MKLISVVTPTFNEQSNVRDVYESVKAIFYGLSEYQYEHIFIDNHSDDKTVSIIKSICSVDNNVKLIVNARNFGPVRSTYYGNLQAHGDAVIHLVADLQDPPELIVGLIRKWEEGFKIVVGVKTASHESYVMFAIRKAYYNFIARIADVVLIKNYTGFGLYDKSVINILRELDDPYPYFRGLISEIGYEVAQIEYVQPVRKRGVTSTNFYSLYDQAMLGITSHSKLPIRLTTMVGFALSGLSFATAIIYLLFKLIYWDQYQLGIASILIGIFFFFSIQLFSIGLLGEYIASIHTQVKRRPLVFEKERVNFDKIKSNHS